MPKGPRVLWTEDYVVPIILVALVVFSVLCCCVQAYENYGDYLLGIAFYGGLPLLGVFAIYRGFRCIHGIYSTLQQG